MKVSVIIPVYNVERFIERSVCSLMEQTLQDVEYIFVDDASPDNSMNVLHTCLERYPKKMSQIKILRNKENKGLPASRNEGLKVATGKYIFHFDSDDYAEPGMLEQMYCAASQSQADIVWCDWFLTTARGNRYMKQPAYATPLEALKGMLSGAMKYNVWNKLVRRSLYDKSGVLFPSGYGMGEDMTTMLLFAHARTVAYLPQAFYHYVKTNSQSFCQTYSKLHLAELRHNADETIQALQRIYGEQLNDEIAFFKLEVKFPFLLSAIKGKYELWQQWYPEANPHIRLNRRISCRSRWVQWLAWKKCYAAVSVYRRILNWKNR